MKVLLTLLAALLAGCGDTGSCTDVDTSQAPTSIYRSSTYTTYYWGDCSRTYPTGSYDR